MNFDKEAPRELKKKLTELAGNLMGIAILKNDTKG